VPIAAYARLVDGKLVMDSLVGSISGDRIIRDHAEGRPEDAEVIGTMLAESLLSKGADKILAEVYGQH
jgi:hydroxymethylbilane synthase